MVAQQSSEESVDMGQLLDESEGKYRAQRGEILDGVIMKVDRDGMLVNVGLKTEGIIPAREMRSLAPEAIDALEVGDPVVVCVVQPESDEGHAVLSLDRARSEVGWRKLQVYADNGTCVEAEVVGYNKGGAIVTVEGVQAFVPLSQLATVKRAAPGSNDESGLAALVGQVLPLKVIEVNRKRNRAILSERAALQERRQEQKQHLLEDLAEGDLRQGRVSGITNFGVFVDLGGADGLIHVSELSWGSVRSPEEVVQVGNQVEVLVLKVERETKRIALSLKRTQPEPWVTVGVRYQVGQVVPATITKLASFGAFARLEGGIEGLIHISELTDRVIHHPKEAVREGDQVKVKIVKLDLDRRRIGLSLKQVEESGEGEEFRQIEGEYRIERPALGAALAAELAQAVSESSESGGSEAASFTEEKPA